MSIKSKIEAIGTPLKEWDINIYRGVLTGCNEAFIISGKKKDEILLNCKTEAERKRTAEIIRPILRGKDIKRYGYTFADLWLINTHNGIKGKQPRIDVQNYPAIKKHLDEYFPQIKNRIDQGDSPYNLRSCAYMDDFNKPRIVYCEIGMEMNACLIEHGYFINNKLYMISGENLAYLLLFLNSKIFNKILLKAANITGGKGVDFMKEIKVIKPDISQIQIAEKLLSAKDSQKENFINSLYDFSSEEIEFIEAIL